MRPATAMKDAAATRVLLVADDDPQYLRTARLLRTAKRTPYHLQRATSYRNGLAAIRTGQFDACLIDSPMQAHNGIDFVREAVESNITTPIILLVDAGNQTLDAMTPRRTNAILADQLDKADLTAALLDRSIHYAIEQGRLRQRLAEAQACLRPVIDALPIGIATLDLAGHVLAANQSWGTSAECPALTGGQAAGGNYLLACDRAAAAGDRVAAQIAEVIRKVARREQLTASVEYACGAARETRWYALRVSLVEVPGGSARLAVTRNEITERYRLQEQLTQSQKMEAIGRLAGGIAHDFNNLLTVILGCSGSILRGETTPVDRALYGKVQMINNAGERAAALTGQLLALSRRQTPEQVRLDVNDVVQGMESLIRRLVGEQIELTVDLRATALVKMNVSQVEQVLLNLVTNSRDAMPRGGALQVATDEVVLDNPAPGQSVRPGRYVAIRVTDSGMGMDEGTQERMFEPFFTTKKAGTGLGLSTVSSIVQQSNGMLKVQTAPGRGTSVTALLPVNEDVEAPVYQPAQEAVTPNAAPASILVIDDDSGVRELIQTLLRDDGFHVTSADTPAAVMELLQAGSVSPDLVLTDVAMPGISGPQLVQHMRQKWPELGVVYMSGYSRARSESIDLPESQDYLQKPFRDTDLRRSVKAALARTELRIR